MYPSDLGDNLIEADYERPSIETEEWAVYWDNKQRDWYYYDKISGEGSVSELVRDSL